jgi:L-alanine-DL-glutamate epimerase-like enolase superfamily enzyme
MKITKLEAIPCSIPRQGGGPGSNVVLIKVYTDEGIIGAGEGGQCNQDAVMLTAKTMGGMIIGENPFDIGLIMNKLSMGFGGSNATFNSSIDFALYDIMGKAMNQPVYQFLGGKALEKP